MPKKKKHGSSIINKILKKARKKRNAKQLTDIEFEQNKTILTKQLVDGAPIVAKISQL